MPETGKEIYHKLLDRVQQLVDARIDTVRAFHPDVYSEGDRRGATVGLSKGEMIVHILLSEFEYFSEWIDERED